MKVFLGIFTLLIIVACGARSSSSQSESLTRGELVSAELFSIEQCDSFKIVTVTNPWIEGKELGKYILVHRDSILPKNLPQGELIRVPVRRVAVYGALDAGMIEVLGESSTIVGVCEPHFMQLPFVDNGIADGSIVDLGMANGPNAERMLVAKPELIFSTPYQGLDNSNIKRLGIPMAECANYMENVPLGRSEWLKFVALFYAKEQLADSIYNSVVDKYNNIKQITSKPQNKRTILTGKRYGQTWWVPAGDSYAAKLYADASADYFWKETPSAGSIGLSFEEVFVKAAKADIWLIRYYKEGSDMTLKELCEEYESYEHFEAFKNHEVWGCNTAVSDYYTYGIINPDIELRDIAVVLYPERFEDTQTIFYKRMK